MSHPFCSPGRIRILAFALTVACAATFMTTDAKAYCVYNKTDSYILVEQVYGGSSLFGFKAYLNPGEKACCNWRNNDCNKNYKKTSTVKFKVTYTSGDPNFYSIVFCKKKSIKAGGWLTVKGKYPDGRCIAHY